MEQVPGKDPDKIQDDTDQADMAKVMGFSNFGGPKKARTFDVTAMFMEARRTAIERNQKPVTHIDTEVTPDGGSSSSEDDAPKPQGNRPNQLGAKFKSAGFRPIGPATAASSEKKEDEGDEDDDIIGPPLPPSLNSKEEKPGEDEDEEEEEIGPPLPPGMKKSLGWSHEADNEQEEEPELEDEDDDNPVKKIPRSHEIALDHGKKMVSALALDPSGARLVSGGYDYIVKFWDFAGMDATLQSFRQLQPCESHLIKTLEYSSTGDMILVVAGNSQAKVIDRDGFEVLECVKGDQYIADKAKTKGHAGMLNSGCWNPKVKEEFVTCSNDGTVRLWDVNQNGQTHSVCVKTRCRLGRMTMPITCTFSRDGRWVAAACQDGSIQIWDRNRKFITTSMVQRQAHQPNTDTSCLCFSYDGRVLASRGGDDSLKTWDIRNFKQPLQVAPGLLNLTPMTDCIFSPDDRLIVTGVSCGKGDKAGQLLFLDRDTLKQSFVMEPSTSSIVRCLWHPRLNQLVVGCGDGSVKLYYDPDKSHRGAKLCVVKTKRKVKQVEMLAADTIITPHALPMFRQARPTSTRKQEEKARKDPVRSHRPDLPVSGPGQGGRLGAKGATLSQYVVQQLVRRAPDERDKDPRAAILRHAEEAAKNPFWVTPAYKSTQPNPVFKEDSDSEEEDKDDGPLWKKQKTK